MAFSHHGAALFKPFVGFMVDYFIDRKTFPGVISKVKPLTDKLFDVEVEIPGETPLKMTWPNEHLFFCGE